MTNLFDHSLDVGSDGAIDARGLPAHGGVYLVVDRDDRPVLLASGECLRRVVVHRLAAPPPDKKSKRTNLSEVAGRVWWRDTFSQFETALTHWQIARAMEPKTYRTSVAFPPAWFLRVDPADRAPRFAAVCEFHADAARYVGPFATRHDAEEWSHMLEDLFDLCRHQHVLEQAPHGQACAYFEMGKCAAPCDGTTSLNVYRQMIADALAFSTGEREPRLAALRGTMQSAAEALAFEKAVAIRQTIDRAAATIKKAEYRHLADLPACCWLVVQRGGPARRAARNAQVKPFFVRCGTIEAGEPVKLPELESSVPRWLCRCGPCSVLPPGSRNEQTARCEVLWLVSKFLFQGGRAPGLFYRFDRLPDADALARAVRERFAPRAGEQGDRCA
ncbi:MAG: hypothetical protein JXQ75_22170 [Phycisphaerae bacterium]|nr:hypothetical protein [Phycisphaerae bacterium]